MGIPFGDFEMMEISFNIRTPCFRTKEDFRVQHDGQERSGFKEVASPVLGGSYGTKKQMLTKGVYATILQHLSLPLPIGRQRGTSSIERRSLT
jgi:hypothetical protein